jgi:hypothetical protein
MPLVRFDCSHLKVAEQANQNDDRDWYAKKQK